MILIHVMMSPLTLSRLIVKSDVVFVFTEAGEIEASHAATSALAGFGSRAARKTINRSASQGRRDMVRRV